MDMDFLLSLDTSFVQQIIVLVILAGGLILFTKNQLRYDVTALILMAAIIVSGILSPEEAFANFGHPAIVVVACMFVMSEAFVRSGIIDAIVMRLSFLYQRPIIALGCLIVIVTILSAFINNAGALAIVIPIAVHLAQKSHTPITLFLLPLAFASHLGGFMTLIGTPRNIIISDFRLQSTGIPYQMFDFLSVGGLLAIIGMVFLIVISWRLIPLRKNPEDDVALLRQYTTEVSISATSPAATMTVSGFEKATKHSLTIMAVYRDMSYIPPQPELLLGLNDLLIIKGDIPKLTYYTEHLHLALSGKRAMESHITTSDDQASIEAIVPPYTKLVGQDWDSIPLRERFGINFIGICRPDSNLIAPLSSTRIWPNDVVLLQGRRASIEETIKELRLLPLATSDIAFGRNSRVFSTVGILIIAVTLATLNWFSLPVIFLITCLLLIVTDHISLRQAYESIDATVLILLAGMITLGAALEKSGAAASIATQMLSLSEVAGPIILLVTVLVVTGLFSDLMNSTAAVVTMAPIGILIANSLAVSIDPFLMAVAVGSSCAFLTPIGHESNAMVMQRGGYTFKDYFHVGLPLELLILASSIPCILYFWPF